MFIVKEDSKYYYSHQGYKYNKREYFINEDMEPEEICDCSKELKEDSGLYIPIVRNMNPVFQRVYLMVTDEKKYLTIYDGPYDWASSRCLRLSIETPELISCTDGILDEWWLTDGMIYYLCDFLNSNVRDGLPVEPLSVWDYMVYLYNTETGQNVSFTMPDYTKIIEERDKKEIEEFGDDAFDDSLRLTSMELKEDLEVTCHDVIIADGIYLSIPEQPTSRYATYFILTNDSIPMAVTKICRISFIEPKYIECNDMPDGVENWVLSKDEIHILINALTANNNRLWNDLLYARVDDPWPIYQTILVGIPVPDYTKLLEDVK